jgi:hypothetical protein
MMKHLSAKVVECLLQVIDGFLRLVEQAVNRLISDSRLSIVSDFAPFMAHRVSLPFHQ